MKTQTVTPEILMTALQTPRTQRTQFQERIIGTADAAGWFKMCPPAVQRAAAKEKKQFLSQRAAERRKAARERTRLFAAKKEPTIDIGKALTCKQ